MSQEYDLYLQRHKANVKRDLVNNMEWEIERTDSNKQKER